MNGKRRFLFPMIFVLTFMASRLPTTGRQETAPTGVTVAVRVLDGEQFVDGLTLSDFELSEDGIPQQIQGFYEVDKNAVTRKEGPAASVPVTARRIYLLFQMYEYNPKVSEAFRYFFNNALLPGDTLQIQTPVKSYMLTPQAFAQKPKDLLATEMDEIVRKDIVKSNSVYMSLLRELRRLVQGIQDSTPISGGDEADGGMVSYFSLEQLLNQYRQSLTKLEAQQSLDQGKIIAFAQALKKQEGRKFLFFFYQEEYRPTISSQTLNVLIDNNQDSQSILSDLNDLFQAYHRDMRLDVDKTVQAYCDSGATFNFLFMKRTPEKFGGVTMREMSEDVFKVFSQVAVATGGIAETTQRPLAEVKDAVKAMDAYYLLTYTPSSAVKDGTFRRISVKIIGSPYKISCGQGYIAR
jgi:VWFA-related protein